MSLDHPISGEPVSVTAPVPDDMRTLLEAHGLWKEEYDTIE
jgi:hypothetical protein